MNPWWKMGITAVAIIFLFNAGFSVKGKFDEAAQADILRDQIKAATAKNDQLQKIAVKTEAKEAADRQVISSLQQQWSADRAKKKSPDCPLSSDSLSLLGQATVPHIRPATR